MSSLPAKSNKQVVEKSPRVQLSLRVLTGMHAGAEIRLPARGILMIGQADDCDLILADEGIAAHHCVLTVVGDQVLLRPMDGGVATHDGPVAANENITLEHFAVAHLADVQLAVGPHWNERWQSLADATGNGHSALTEQQLGKRRRGLLSIVALLLLIAILVLFGSWKVNHPVIAPVRNTSQQIEQAQAILHKLSLNHVRVSAGADNHLQIRGIVGNAAQLPQLQHALSEAGLSSELTVRDWPSVAKQVTDIFAMHGYTVETQLLDQGGMVVAGHFGDRDNADKVRKEVFGSNDMQSLDADSPLGLQLALKNYDETPQTPPKPDPNKQILHVISGNESYLVTKDRSHYYPGSTLPQAQGGVFLGVADNDAVLLRMPDNSLKQLERDDGYQTLQPIDDATVSAFLPQAPAAASTATAASAATSTNARGPTNFTKH